MIRRRKLGKQRREKKKNFGTEKCLSSANQFMVMYFKIQRLFIANAIIW